MALSRTDLDKETFDAFELEFPGLSEQACVSVLGDGKYSQLAEEGVYAH